jgi:tRNA(fMet)-specific endonuclease VapC
VIRYFMLDTNTVSDLMKGQSRTVRMKLQTLAQDEIGCLSAITEGELRYGFAKRPNSAHLIVLYEELLQSLQVLPWGSDQALAYGRLRARLEASGKPLGPLDLLIASHAISVVLFWSHVIKLSVKCMILRASPTGPRIFSSYGTGSSPPLAKGWHRASLRMAIQPPRNHP